jgi:hypothetical protein
MSADGAPTADDDANDVAPPAFNGEPLEEGSNSDPMFADPMAMVTMMDGALPIDPPLYSTVFDYYEHPPPSYEQAVNGSSGSTDVAWRSEP